MIRLVNEELFALKNTPDAKNPKIMNCTYTTKGTFIKSVVDPKDPTKKISSGTSFDIFNIVCPADSTYDQFNMTLKTTKGKNGKSFVSGVANETVKRDTSLIMIAFPYDGLLKPFPEKMPFRVIKGFIAQSDYSTVKYDGKKFRKVLYLIVTANEKMLEPDHPYHKDELYFNIDTYMSVKQPDGSAPVKSKLHRLTVSVKKDSITCRNVDRVVDFVDMKQYEDTPAWKPTEPPAKPESEHKPYQKRETSSTRPAYKGNTSYASTGKSSYNASSTSAPKDKKYSPRTDSVSKSEKVTSTYTKKPSEPKIVKKVNLSSGTEENEVVASSGSAGTSLDELLKKANLTPAMSKREARKAPRRK